MLDGTRRGGTIAIKEVMPQGDVVICRVGRCRACGGAPLAVVGQAQAVGGQREALRAERFERRTKDYACGPH